MKPTRTQILLLAVNLVLAGTFAVRFARQGNTEFLIYVGVVLAALTLVAVSTRWVRYRLGTLIGLTVWAALHLAGGGLSVGEGRLYDVMLWSWSTRLPVLRYDQVVHAWGFGACVWLCHDVLRGHLARPAERSVAIAWLVMAAALGLGALNEVVEFVVTRCVPGAGVGGYVNTALDLCANLVGAVLAWIVLCVTSYRSRPKR